MQQPKMHPELPAEGKVRYPALKRITGVAARSTIWRLERAGKFPKSTRITPRLTVWDAAELREWLADPVAWAAKAATLAEAEAKNADE